jgi:hypothetical protein
VLPYRSYQRIRSHHGVHDEQEVYESKIIPTFESFVVNPDFLGWGSARARTFVVKFSWFVGGGL